MDSAQMEENVSLEQALRRGIVGQEERVVLFNTGSGLKYPMKAEVVNIDKDKPVDFEALLKMRKAR